jgi:2-polyprenyl-3-methyl-5-hydroxy-6-metoxy-1,4-benzoquinol methylase
MMIEIDLWGVNIPTDLLSESDKNYIQGLPEELPTVEWIWGEMDRVWDFYNLKNKQPLEGQAIVEFYSHPVWLMNGVFTSLDTVSEKHRDLISQFIQDKGLKVIADYAGGFGELALKSAKKSTDASIKIIEPFPSAFGLHRLKEIKNIEVVSHLGIDEYDVIIAQDVLEHVEDPIGLAIALTESVKGNGLIIFANCFYPVIKCHLPTTFHLRQTFRFVMAAYGITYVGRLAGAEHVQIFKKIGQVNVNKARSAEKVSRILGGSINFLRTALSKIKHN